VSYVYGPDDLPIEQISTGGTVTYLHHDQQGSTRLLTGSTGKAEATLTYDPYGNQTGHTGTATTVARWISSGDQLARTSTRTVRT
jgi:hypothetical protein